MSGAPRLRELWLWGLGALAYAVLALYFAHGQGRLDFADHARGRDFVNVWTASRLLREGRAPAIFDPAPFLAAAHRTFSPRLPFHFWSYPPPALWFAWPLELFGGYFSALIAWTAAGLLALAAAWPAVARALQAQAPLPAWPLALLLASPAVATNIGLGQNGAFTGALLLGGLALIDRRPWLAGALLGALVFKPQIALLLPVMVLAGRRWRVLGGAALSVAVILLATLAVWGAEPWRAFVAHTLPMQRAMLTRGSGPFLWMMTSAYTGARLLHAPAAMAGLAQAPFTLLGVALAWLAWRTPRGRPPPALGARLAITAAATFVATPQGFNYDLIPVAFAALALWSLAQEGGPRLGDRALALAAWALPPLMILLGRAGLPVAPLVLAALAVRLAQRAGVLAWPSRAASPSAASEAISNT